MPWTRLAVVATLAAILLASLAPAQPPTVTQPLRLIVEAEDFKPEKGDWEVKDWGTNYFAATLAVTFLSRQRYLGAPEQGVESVAVKEIDVPRAGTFEVWARYEQPYDYAVNFDVVIEQEGQKVFERAYGRRDQPKLWPFKSGIKPQVLFSWGPGDNIVWEGKDSKVTLKPGKAKLTLRKGPQSDKQAARRHVDVLMLTDDSEGVAKQIKEASYLALDGWLTQAGDVYLTVTNPKDSGAAIATQVGPCTEHSPYWVHVRDWPKTLFVAKKESATAPTGDDLLKPGETSPRVEVGRLFDTLNQFQWTVTVLGPDGKPAANKPITLGFSLADGQDVGTKTYQTQEDGTVAFFLDGDLRRTKTIRTVEDDLKELQQFVGSLPKRGRTPEKYLISGIMGASTALERKGPIGDLCRNIALSMGSNTLPFVAKPERNGQIDLRHVATKDLTDHCAKLKQSGQDKRVRVVSLGDEIHVAGAAKSPDDDPAFRRFLETKGIKPDALKLKSLDEARVELQDKSSRMYYHSHLFAMEKAINQLKERTDIVEAQLGKDVAIGANYSPHPYYWPKEGQWMRLFKRRAMTLPWSEDYVWQCPEASPQIIGYLMAALRCGAANHDLPMHFYVMPHAPGNTPENLRRAYYTALAHGAKHLDFFCATPLSTAYTENYVRSQDKETWKTIHEMVQETGMFEHVAYSAKPRQADVAILSSFAQDLWEPDPAYNHERKCQYLCHRLAGYAVDFVTEEDVQDGRIGKYKCLLIVGNHLERTTAEKLKLWVKDQGRAIVGVAGGGFFDEFNQPMDVLHEVYGITEPKLHKQDAVIMTKTELPRLKPIDRIEFFELKKNEFNALAYKLTFKGTDKNQPWAKYKDGSPAITRSDFGNGVGLLYGSFVASEYVRQAIPLKPFDRATTNRGFNHFLPQEFDGHLSDIVTAGASAGEARYDVITDNPMVESTVMEGPDGLALVLVNWTPHVQNLNLTVQFVPRGMDRVTSMQQGPLKSQRIGVTVSFKTRVETTDVILLERP